MPAVAVCPQDLLLPPCQKRKQEEMMPFMSDWEEILFTMTCGRESIETAMVFAIEHSDFSATIVKTIVKHLSSNESSITQKVSNAVPHARLFRESIRSLFTASLPIFMLGHTSQFLLG